MTKKLYVATIEIEMVVYAESADEAQKIAANNFREEVSNNSPTTGDFMTSDYYLPAAWDYDSVPWAARGVDVKTIKEIIEEAKGLPPEPPKAA